jgi:peroxiredoxin
VDRAIDFELPSSEGGTWRLADHLASGPVVLVFYRGDW